MYLEVEVEVKRQSSEEIGRAYNEWQDNLAVWHEADTYTRGEKPEEPVLDTTLSTMYLNTLMIDGPAFTVPGSPDKLEISIAGCWYVIKTNDSVMQVLKDRYGSFTNP